MKRTILLIAAIFTYGFINAQTLLFDNGPMVNSPGMGLGGADVSNIHDFMTLYGFNHAVTSGLKVAEDFAVPVAGWTVDSMVFFAYQTQTTPSIISTINEVRVGIWDGSPMVGANIIFGDTAMDALTTSYWSGIYRTTANTLTNAQRAIMRNVVATPGLVLGAGTYFVSWQTGGTTASGPWAPPVTLGAGITTTGDAIQYSPTTGLWSQAKDTAVNAGVGSGTGSLQGLPFLVYGHLTTVGVNEQNKSEFGITNVYPVPAIDKVNFIYNTYQNETVHFSINDNAGREVQSLDKKMINGENKLMMDITTMQAGLYFITARSASSFNMVKFIKE